MIEPAWLWKAMLVFFNPQNEQEVSYAHLYL